MAFRRTGNTERSPAPHLSSGLRQECRVLKDSALCLNRTPGKVERKSKPNRNMRIAEAKEIVRS